MQPRLMRSRNEAIIAGVCGGLAEYFAIDPVIVRLIFVLVTLTTGIGFIVYPVLWIVMPKAGTMGGQFFPHDADEWRRRAQEFGEEASQVGQQFSREVREVLRQGQSASSQSRPSAPTTYADAPPPPEAYNFDPITGQPIDKSGATTGRTVNLRVDPSETNLAIPPVMPNVQPQPAPRRRGRALGFILLAIGVLVLANIFNIDRFVFPLILIGAGFLLLRKRS